MEILLEIPDDLVPELQKAGRDLSRQALEAFALQAYTDRRISASQVRRLLGFTTRYELDGFLKSHQIWLDYTLDDLRNDRETHQRLGFGR